MKAIIKKMNERFSAFQWFIILWVGGVLSLLFVAGVFRLLLQLAY